MARETKAQKAEREAAEQAAADSQANAGANIATVGGETAVVEAPLNLDLLSQIVAATQGNSFVYTAQADYEPLVAAGHVEINPGMVNETGSVATRATATGIQYMADANNNAATGSTNEQSVAGSDAAAGGAALSAAQPAAAPAGSGFVIASVPLPTRKSERAGRSSSYPFDALEVGQSFFVPATEAKPNPRKSLASTVSSATRRFATKTDRTRNITVKGVAKSVPVYEETRKFEVFEGTGDNYGQPGVKGAIVGRTK